MKPHPFLLIPLAATLSQAWADDIEHSVELSPVTVTGTQQQKANMVKFDPKATLQPLPAGDGADLLQSVPNMSIIRKGGSSGDPLFRGLGGSRLSITADDQFIYGGCSNRMDPPTAYIHPNTFDEVVVTKGPQTVTQGMGLISGSVHFVRKEPKFDEQNYTFNGSTTLGSNNRRDAAVEAGIGGKYGYIRTNISHNESDDYRDGDGNTVHSRFKRDSQMLQAGITPTENTTLAGTYERSRGYAAYADRMMDGSKFDRDAWNIRLNQRRLTSWLSELELRYGESRIDHVMDTYSLRPVGMMGKRAMNPKRRTDTGNLKAVFDWERLNLQTGIDYMHDRHADRSGSDYAAKPYTPTQSFKQWGGFAEAAWQQTDRQKWVGGIRHDQIAATYEPYPDSDPAKHQKYRLISGFIRWEQSTGNAKFYAGLGIAQRAPDYWERNKSEDLKKETNRQLDTGIIWNNGKLHLSASLFAGRIHDFIMVEQKQTMHHHGGHGHTPVLTARNIDASRIGGELEAKWQFAPHWNIGSSLAYTRGSNRTDHLPLAQTPPLEWNNTLTFDNGKFSAGALWKLVARQNRYSKGQGNIIGQDLGASAGFGVLSINTGWKFNKHATLQAGIDNLFDKTYAEFVSKGGSHIDPAAGIKTTRVNEPGRTAWLRLQARF